MISTVDLLSWTRADDLDVPVLRRLEQAAIAALQKRTGRYLGITAAAITEIIRFRGWPLQLANSPTGSVITSLEQWDGSVWTTVPAADYYLSGTFIWSNVTATVPVTTVVPIRYRVIYPGGYAGTGDIWAAPADIQQAVLLLVGHWFENRESVVTGTISTEVDLALTWLLQGQTPATV